MTSHIRIPDVSPVAQALADGARSVFPFSFPIFQAGDIEVRANSTLVATGYTVVGEGSSTGGAVIFADAPASGVRITLRRRQTYARTDDFLDERAPTPHELNDAVDRNVAALQELDEQVSRSVRRPLSADLSQPLDLSLPAPEAGKAIGWNGSADALVNLAQADVSDFLRKSQNLADLSDTATARNNLGLGSAALRAEGDFATAAQGARADSALQSSDIGNSVQAHDAALDWLAGNLSESSKALLDDTDAAAQRATLGLAPVASSGSYNDLSGRPTFGSAAALDVDADGTLAANADSRLATQKAVKTYVDGKVGVTQAEALLKAQNLADLPDKAAARGNLGLGTAAVKDVGTAAGQVVALDAAGHLPAVNGSAVTSLNADALTSGTVAAARLGSGTADGSTFLRGDGTWASGAGGTQALNVQIFTSSGTFTVPSTKVKFTLLGGGGGGGGFASDEAVIGAGGGSGALAIKALTGLTVGNTIAVTVGAGGAGGASGGSSGNAPAGAPGGDTVISSGTQTIATVTAGGGSGGGGASTSSSTPGGLGGIATNGDLNIPGVSTLTNMVTIGGAGASSIYGQGGVAPTSRGNNATGYGSGGSCGYPPNGFVGGAGSSGFVIAEWVQ